MSAFNNLLSRFFKDKMDDIASAVKDKFEDVMEDALHPDEDENVTVTVAEQITIQELYHRLGQAQAPMTGEEFIELMRSAGFEAVLCELPEEVRKKIPDEIQERSKLYAARHENGSPLFSAMFQVYRDETDVPGDIESFRNNLKKAEGVVFLADEEDRLFVHSTIVTSKDTYKTYNLYSRVGNTLLRLTIPEENADTYATDIIRVLQGSGY